MERKINLIGNFATDWIRYSDYEYKTNDEGHLYIVPKEDAVFSMYNPFDIAEDLVIDFLKIGDAYKSLKADKTLKVDKPLKTDNSVDVFSNCAHSELDAIKNQVMIFAKKYGLMGFISSNVYNRDIIGDDIVLLMDENSLKTKSKVMDSEAYMKLFTPFADEHDLSIRRYRNSVDLKKAEDSPKYYGKRPLVMDLIFSRFYAEQLEWILEFAGMLSEHFNQLLVYKAAGGRLTEAVTILAKEFKVSKVGFTINHLDKTLISWDFDALKTALQTIYAFAVTDPNIILSRCEHCRSFYIALSSREKYCGPVCRNRSNVQKSRKRKSGLEEDLKECE